MMPNPLTHLSEDDRQLAADGTLDAADRGRVSDHLAACRDCAADVARLTTLMTRIGEARGRQAPAAPVLDELWPAIRRQIDGAKVVSLDAESPAVTSRRFRLDPWIIGVAASVAAITAITVIQVVPPVVRTVTTSVVSSDSVFRLASDSVQTYEQQASQLLDELKMQRARLQPDTRESIDDDLKTIDLAIAELQLAIARDPKNAVLRSMLASSYRQKVDVLKKVGNAS
jgi:anti-sigma factor RsiW